MKAIWINETLHSKFKTLCVLDKRYMNKVIEGFIEQYNKDHEYLLKDGENDRS